MIALEDDLVHPLLPVKSVQTNEPERKQDLEDLSSKSRRLCDTLLKEMPTAPIVKRQREPTEEEVGVTNRWTSSFQRVTFPNMQENFTNRNPKIEKPSETGNPPTQSPTLPIHK